VRVLSEGEGFLEIYRDVTAHVPVRGNLVPDAHLAAVLRHVSFAQGRVSSGSREVIAA